MDRRAMYWAIIDIGIGLLFSNSCRAGFPYNRMEKPVYCSWFFRNRPCLVASNVRNS